MTTTVKTKAAKEAEETVEESTEKTELDEQIEVFEPVAKAVDRKFIHPETEESKIFVQHEMSFMTKIKFFRLLSGTLRLASDTEGANPSEFLQEAFGSQVQDENVSTGTWLTGIMHLVELVPDFLEQAFVLVLNVRPNDEQWFIESLENLDDEEGIDIIEKAIEQNGPAIRRFFDKHLPRLGETVSREVGNPLEDTEQE